MAKLVMSSRSSAKYDVFISFRGEDVRTTFVSHLRSALQRHNIKSYADDHDLQKGDEMWPSLSKAIKDSLLAIVVFSEKYADSKWCLKELVEILNCRKTQGLVLIPVFYQVDPSLIRKYSGTYGEAIAKHETYFGDEHKEFIQAWKAALAEAANISGWDSSSPAYKDEYQVIEKIVEDVTEKLSLRSPVELKVEELVQFEASCEEVKLLLYKKQRIGIWGMGGIGKTTIAKALFSQLFPQYDGVCFLANVREESKRIGLICLCDKLLSELLKEGHHKYNFAGYEYNLKRLGNKKVLIVLDDVDCPDQLDGLCKQCDYAGPNSKVIITTRNRHLLSGRVDKIYEVKTWNFPESLELFSLHAFKKRLPKEGYEDLSRRAVTYAGGVPLALKVLGSNLYDRSTEFWDYELRKLTTCPNDKIQNVLQVSFDGLDNLQQKIFLDIAFFFKGENKDDVIRILDACGFYAASGIKVLEDKALVTISYSGTIQMHDLIQEMGLNIVRGCSEDPGKRSRLRNIEEVCDVLENKKGSGLVEGIKLDLSLIEDLHLNFDSFNMMTNLRILRLHVSSSKRSGNVHHSGVLSKLSCELRYLEWNGCPLKSLPVTFCAKMLVEIRMQHSHVTELWHGLQDVANLVRIDLIECKHLIKLPDLSMASKLKWVNLSGCESLCDIHPSVFSFDTIEFLTLDGCKMLNSLKSEKHLTSLKHISVNGCTSLREFSVSSDLILKLDLSSTGIKVLDPSIGDLKILVSLKLPSLGHGNLRNGLSFPKYLKELRICNCRVAIEKQKLHVVFGGLKSLRLLQLQNCCNLCELPDNISGLSNLRELILDGSCVKTLPASIKLLTNLETLSLANCRKLESLPELPPNVTVLNAVNCSSLGTISTLTSFAIMRGKGKYISFENCVRLDEPYRHCIMEGALLATISAMFLNIFEEAGYVLILDRCIMAILPGRRVPGQFKCRKRDSTITINLPSSKSHFVGLTFCVVLSPSPGMKNIDLQIRCQCYLEDGTSLVATSYHNAVTALISDHVLIWCSPSLFDSILEIYKTANRRVSFEFSVTNGMGERVNVGITECGVCQIFYSQDLEQGDLALGVNKSRVHGLELGSHHGATSMVTATSDENDCNDTDNHERYSSQHFSSSGNCTVDTSKSIVSDLHIATKAVNDEAHENNEDEKGPGKEQNQNVQPTSSTKTNGSLSQIDLEMLENDPFSLLDMWSTNSLPSHGSKPCPDTATIDEANIAMAQFQELAFGDFKIKLSTPGFQTKLREVVGKLENLGKSIPETFKVKVEEFMKTFNHAFEANKSRNKCIKSIEEIEASTQEDRSKLAQAREEYAKLQKTFWEMDQCLPSLVESEQKLAKEEEEIAKQLESLQHKLNAIRKQQEDIKADKLANKEKQETYVFMAKHIKSLLENQLQEKKKLEQEQIDFEKVLDTLLEDYTNMKLKSGV